MRLVNSGEHAKHDMYREHHVVGGSPSFEAFNRSIVGVGKAAPSFLQEMIGCRVEQLNTPRGTTSTNISTHSVEDVRP